MEVHRPSDVSQPPTAATLIDVLHAHAASLGDKQAFQIVRDRGGEDVGMTYRQLHHRALAIGGHLQARIAPGERALLLFPPGLDFIAAFFGCLYAGVVAVPAAVPARKRATSSVEAVFKASGSMLVLSNAEHCRGARQFYAHRPALLERPWITIDEIPDDARDAWRDPKIDRRHTAFLQYTSGSTSSPKGVILSHENLLHNAAIIQQAFGNRPADKGVSWLPLYHDMGLIGGVVQPVYCGGACTLIPPVAFLQRPALWLETISRTRATVSGGPDFAYDLCVRKVSPEQFRSLDLSSWKVAFTGAERIRADTLERFAAMFAPAGFSRESFFPCYGLAEATLMVSGGPRHRGAVTVHVLGEALAAHRVHEVAPDHPSLRTLVGCGQCLPGQTVKIVDPQTHRPCEGETVGEIWVHGPSVTGGYHGLPEATQVAFQVRLGDTGEGPFLRTGDLGFLRDGQLFVTGRLKDIIIIRGRNYYPEDIEQSVDAAHAAFRAKHCAAFSIEVDDCDRLAIVQEIEPRWRDLDVDAAFGAIRCAVATEHELEVHTIVLAKAGEIPKTSSGKIRRAACRERLLNGQLEMIAQWSVSFTCHGSNGQELPEASCPLSITAAVIEGWLVEWIAARLGASPAQVCTTAPFTEFGLSSLDAVEMAAEMERRVGRQLSPTALYNYPNIAALSQWIAQPPALSETPAERPAPPLSGESHPQQLLDEVRNMSEEDIHTFLISQKRTQSGDSFGLW